MTKKRIGLPLLMLLLFLLMGSSVLAEEKITVTYYYYNSCASCTEGERFEQEFKDSIADAVGEDAYTFSLKDVSKEEYYNEFMEIVEEKKTPEFYPQPPLLIIDDQYLFGLEEITNQARNVMIQKAQETGGLQAVLDQLKGIDPSDSFLVYFYMPECEQCQKVEGYLDAMSKELYIEGELSRVKSVYVNIGNLDAIPLANYFYDKYQVAEQNRKAPVIFYQNGYLQGFEDVRDHLPKVLESGRARGWQDIDYQEEEEKGGFTPKEWVVLMLTGMLNGLNPCGISVLLLFISLLLTKKEKIVKLGCSFVLAKFFTYLVLGIVFGSVFSQVGERFIRPAGNIFKWILAVVFVFLAILNFRDFLLARQEKYGKMKLQLPASLKKFNQRYLERVMADDHRWLAGLVFAAGIVISAGEFLCTGQLYLASILYMMERQNGFQWGACLAFVAYVACMCVPLLLIVAGVNKSAKLFSVSELVRKKIWLVKLIYGCLFLAFAVLMVMARG